MLKGYHSHCHYYQDDPSVPVLTSWTAIYLHPHSDEEEYGFDPGLSLDISFFPETKPKYILPPYFIDSIICDCMKKPYLFGNHIFDCINGIICLGDEINGLVLWNPAIREYKVVPEPPCHNYHSSNDVLAFGYDHNSNDYKLVRILTDTYQSDLILHPVVVHVYNLSTDSWRQIDLDFDLSIIDFPGDSNELYFNGVYHWCSCILSGEYAQRCEVIVCFDMTKEVFRTMRMPDLGYISSIKDIKKTLGVLSNCLALIVHNINKMMTNKHLDIWVMREYGVQKSWTKQFVIGPLLIIPRAQQFLFDVQLLLVCDKLVMINGKGQILLYEFGAQEIKNLQLRNLPNSFFVSKPIVYMKSLVSVSG